MVLVQSLSPGLVVSEMTTLNKKGSPKRQALMNSHPILQPEDISDAVCYILSTAENVQVLSTHLSLPMTITMVFADSGIDHYTNG
jgi:NADP-dependent 3-hydroxy acid dehydrogenase YdfG